MKTDRIVILGTLEDASKNFKEVRAEVVQLKGLLRTIDVKLKSQDWVGAAHDKCVDIHELITKYEREISPIHAELQTCTDKLINETKGFHTNTGAESINILNKV